MPYFVFKALNARSKIVNGRLLADTLADANRTLKHDYQKVLECKEEQSFFASIDRALMAWRGPSAMEMAFTTRQMATLLNSGVPLTRSLEILCMQPLSQRLSDAWNHIATEVHQGQPISRSMLRYPDVFSMMFVGMVKAGEVSGRLASNLNVVADHLEKEAFVRERIKAALTYPVFVFVICSLMMFFIVQHVLPQFLNGMFRESGITLPWYTRLLIVLTDFLSRPQNLLGVGLAVFLFGYALLRYLKTPVGAYNLERIVLAIPVLRSIVERVMAVRFCRTMSSLVNSGVPLQTSLEITDIVVSSYVMSEHIQKANRMLHEGTPLSTGLGLNPYFPPTVAHFVELGEETGRIGPLLGRLANLFEEDLDLALAEFTILLEPVIMCVMGLFVAFVIISIFVPLYQIMGQI